MVAITIAKYRKAHQLLQEAEAGQSQVRTQTVVQQGGTKSDRSMSVTREITRVVRV